VKTCETVKLFYNEYPYKIVVSNPLSSIFREKNLAQAKTVLDDLQHLYEQQQPLIRSYGRRQEHLSHKTFFEAKNLYIEFSKKINFKLRIEGNIISIYSHNYSWLQHLATKFNANEFWEPRIDISKFNKNTIIIDEPSIYEYKVTLGDNVDPNLADWIISNKDKAKAGNVCLQEIANNGYVKGYYIYIRDEKIIQLLNLFIGNIQRIDKLVYIAKTDK